jgi:tetratricopeptide (TPR) repeat protein
MALGIAQGPSPPTEAVLVDFPLLEEEPQRIPTEVAEWLPEQATGRGDIAGLVLRQAPPATARSVLLVEAEDPWDRRVRICGFPPGAPGGAWSSNLLRDMEGTDWLQIDAAGPTGRRVGQGYSGAPVWVADEAAPGVVGMVVAADKHDRDRVAFMIPTALLLKAWPAVLGRRDVVACPYRGLSPFRERDADLFFGREKEKARLVEAVRRQPLVAVVGASGSGKSSLVLAGLMPALRGDDGLQMTWFRPGPNPFEALAVALQLLLDPGLSEARRLKESGDLCDVLREGRLATVVERILAKTDARQVLLIADQFEELFTLAADAEREAFLDVLVAPGITRPGALTVVLTLRADFYELALDHPGLRQALEGPTVNLAGMAPDQLRRAIEKPALLQGVTIEEGLVDRILADVGESPGRLPLLEFALTQLWERQHQGRLRHKDYAAIRRVDGALSNYADEVYQGLGAAEQGRVRQVFSHLVTLSDRMKATARVAFRTDMAATDWRIVQRLADSRLVVTDLDPSGRETAQLAHEALIQGWEKLRVWVAADRDFLRWREQIQAALRRWEQSRPDDSDLLRGVRLAEAEQWCAERPGQVDQHLLEFVRVSRHGEAGELMIRAGSHEHHNRREEAIACYRRASAIYGDLGDHDGQLKAILALIRLHLDADEFEPGMVWYREAVKLLGPEGGPNETTEMVLRRIAEISDRPAEPLVWYRKVLRAPFLRRQLGKQHGETVRWYRKALTIHRQLGDRYNQAQILARLAVTYGKMHEVDRALWYADSASKAFGELGHPPEQQAMLKILKEAHGLRGEAVLAARRYLESARLLPRTRTAHLRHLVPTIVFILIGLAVWVYLFGLTVGVGLIATSRFEHPYRLLGVTVQLGLPQAIAALGAVVLACWVGGGLLRVVLAAVALLALVGSWLWLYSAIPSVGGLNLLLVAVILRWLLLSRHGSLIQPYTRAARLAVRWVRYRTIDHLVAEILETGAGKVLSK